MIFAILDKWPGDCANCFCSTHFLPLHTEHSGAILQLKYMSALSAYDGGTMALQLISGNPHRGEKIISFLPKIEGKNEYCLSDNCEGCRVASGGTQLWVEVIVAPFIRTII